MALGWIDRARLWMAQGLLKAAALPIVAPWVTASFIEPAFKNLVKEGYKKNSAVFACISALAFSYPEPPVQVLDADENPLPLHPLQKLLRKPNPLMGWNELAIYTVVYKAIGGNAYWYKVRSEAGRVVELWPYHAGQMRPKPGGETWITNFEYDPFGDGRVIDVATRDIVHFKWPSIDPEQPWMAMPPLRAAAQEVDSDNETTRYLFALLKNDAVPRTALVMPKDVTLDDKQWNRLLAQWSERHAGDNRGGIGLLEGGADIKRIGLDMKELALEALHAVPEKRICGAFRVPMSVAGIGEDPSFANSEEAYQRFTESTLSPMWAIDDGEITANLANEFDERLTVRRDISRVRALMENEQARWDKVHKAVTGSYMLVNEGRKLLGQPEVEGGNVFLRGMAVEAVPAEYVAPSKNKKQLPSPREEKSLRAARQVGNALQRVRRELASRMERDVNGYFEELGVRAMTRTLARRKAGMPVMAVKLPDVEDLLTPEDDAELEALVKRFYIELLSASWETWNTALGVEAAFDLTDPAVSAALKLAGNRIKLISETTKDDLRKLLVLANEQGWSVDELARGRDGTPGVRDLITEAYKGRARTIARTELGTAQQKAAVARYASAGVKKVLVLDNGFEDSDPVCQELGNGGQGTVKTLAWADANPLEHPNCVRAFAPYFDE